MKGKFSGTLVGIAFGVFCIIANFTIIIPILLTTPISLFWELIFSSIFGKGNYWATGTAIIIVLIVCSLLILWIFFRKFKSQIKSNGIIQMSYVILFMVIQLFIIPSLLFYINASFDWSSVSDGQFTLEMLKTFPYTSIVLFIFGILIDIFRASNV